MKVAIRADASVSLGSGHVMRCLTLADALREEGARVRFLCTPSPGDLGDLIQARGHELRWLPPHDTAADQAGASLSALADEAPWDWLVVDSYTLDAAWERQLRDAAEKIMVIEDIAGRPHDCDLLLDQGALEGAPPCASHVPAHCRRLLGPRYALLRPQFAVARRSCRPRDGRVGRLLIFFGGSDASGETLKALAAVASLRSRNLAVDVVIGAANPHRAAVAAACGAQSGCTLHIQTADMADLMARADVCVGAGGGASWERCCLGLPALVLATAENQVAQSEALAKRGVQLYLGPAGAVTSDFLAKHLDAALRLPEYLHHMAVQGRALVDGEGTRRVLNQMVQVDIELRRAQASDALLIYTWRNHPDTRRHALDAGEIDPAGHDRWFRAVLDDPLRELLIAERRGEPVGVLRYDLDALPRARISIYLRPGLAGAGLGTRLLLAGEAWLRSFHPQVQTIEATIRPENERSVGAFHSAGFVQDHLVMTKSLYADH